MDSQQNIVPPFDPTGYTSITGAQLLQLISGATPYADKGFVITTTDVGGSPAVPDAATDTLLQNYLWIRQQPVTGLTTLYLWNPGQINSTDSNLLYWNPIVFTSGIPAGSITNNMLAGGISAANLAGSIQLSQLLNSSSYLLTNSVFAPVASVGNITGSFATGLVVAPDSVTNAMLVSDVTTGAPNAPIDTQNLVDQSVTLNKIDPAGSVAGYALTSNGPSVAPSWGSPLQKILQTNAVATTVPSFYVATSSIGQIVNTTAPRLSFSSGAITASTITGLPCGYVLGTTSGSYNQGGPAISLSFVPLSLTSYLLIDVQLIIRCSNDAPITLALYGFNSSTDTVISGGGYASVSAGIVTFHSSATGYAPMPAYPSGLCVGAAYAANSSGSVNGNPTATVTYQTFKFKFIAQFNAITLGQLISIVPFVGVSGAYSLAFNAQSYANSGSTPPTPIMLGGVVSCNMIVTEILLP